MSAREFVDAVRQNPELVQAVESIPWEKDAAEDRPQRDDREEHISADVILIDDPLHENVKKIDAIFAADPAKYKIFARGEDVVCVDVRGADDKRIYRPEHVPHISRMNRHDVRVSLSETMKVFKLGPKELRPTHATDQMLDAYLSRMRSRASEVQLPWLDSVRSVPVIRRDGSLNLSPGYQSESGIWYEPSRKFEPIEIPSNASEARVLMGDLGRVFCQFCFEKDAGEAWDATVGYGSVLATIFGLVLRNLLSTVPLLAISATMQGSGKTKLGESICAIGTGHKTPKIGFDSKTEFEKTLPVPLLAGDQCVLVDNVQRGLTFESPRLEILLTAGGQVGFRTLGKTEVPQGYNRSVFIVTGNNLAIGGELPRRTLMCSLDPNSEHPENRHFDFDPLERALKEFPELVMKVVAVGRWWVRHLYDGGRLPDFGQSAADIGSFTEFNRYVRAMLITLGYADPWRSQAKVHEVDVERLELQELWAALRQEYSAGEPIVVAGLRQNTASRVRQLLSPNGEFSPVKAGRRLCSLQGVILEGWKLQRLSKVHGSTQWTIIPVGERF